MGASIVTSLGTHWATSPSNTRPSAPILPKKQNLPPIARACHDSGGKQPPLKSLIGNGVERETRAEMQRV